MLCLNFPASRNSNEPHVSCFLETPDSIRYTHCMLSLSGHFHLTYPTPSLEAFPNWFSNSWNLLPVIRQVCLDHMAMQQSMSQSCLKHVQGRDEPAGPFPRSHRRAKQHCPLPNGTMRCYEQSHVRDSLGWTTTDYGCFFPPFLKKVLSRISASHHCISYNKNTVSSCCSVKAHFLVGGEIFSAWDVRANQLQAYIQL